MKASILIVCYNQEATVGRAIESVLRQKCSHEFEVVIADDCSSDSTRAIALEYARKYPGVVRVLSNEINKGLVGNYFDAFLSCESDYIGDCAGDDEWLDETRLQRQIDMLDSDSSLSVVFTDVVNRRIGPDGSYVDTCDSENAESRRWRRERIGGREILEGVLTSKSKLPYVLSSALYRRRNLLEIYNRNPEVVRIPEAGIEDLPIIAALGATGDAAYLPAAGLIYYVGGESLSNNLSFEKEFRFHLRVAIAVLRLAKYYKLPKARMKEYISHQLNYMAAQARHSGNQGLKDELKDFADEWKVGLPLRARLHLWLMKRGLNWNGYK